MATINRSLRLPDREYFKSTEAKNGIAIHHTVGGSAQATFNWWTQNPEMIGTAYIIDHDGTIYEVFDPQYWAFQFGLSWPDVARLTFEKRFIGIELASEGGLKEHNGQLYSFDVISPKTLKRRDEAFDAGSDYRGYRYFDKYEPPQLFSLSALINDLCQRFRIPRKVPANFFDYYGTRLQHFEGIIGHAMVRKDKSDPAPDPKLWQRIIADCSLETVAIPEEGTNFGRNLTDEEKEKLFEENVQQINRMNVAAGSMVKGLIMELKRGDRNTYIRLRDAEANGHTVGYDFIQGEKDLVGRIARALGFRTVTDSKLEVHHA